MEDVGGYHKSTRGLGAILNDSVSARQPQAAWPCWQRFRRKVEHRELVPEPGASFSVIFASDALSSGYLPDGSSSASAAERT